MANLALSELLGARVLDATGTVSGRVRELALFPQEDPTQVAAFIVRTPQGDRLLGREDIARIEGGKLQTAAGAAQWMPFNAGKAEGPLLVRRHLALPSRLALARRLSALFPELTLAPALLIEPIR